MLEGGRGWVALGAALGALAVILGAFGAHALKARFSPEALAWWQTGVEYHGMHALALVACGIALRVYGGGPLFAVAGILFAAGILLFSGSLYLLAWTGIRALGAVTPLGGLAFIAAWMALGAAVLRA